MKLGKGIIQVLCANILNLMIAVGNGFLLPKYLSIKDYANLKTFLLYLSYIGVLHLGYIDGLYIKYGGKRLCDINPEVLTKEENVLIFFQALMALGVCIAASFAGNLNLIFVAVCIVPYNMICLYKTIYQAVGEFKEYRHIMISAPVVIFILNILFLFVFQIKDSFYYIGIQVIVYILVFMNHKRKNTRKEYGLSINNKEGWLLVKQNIQLGFVIMLGNFMGIWITSIDRWFVKVCCGVEEFAYYSFAVTMLRLINTIVTAFSVTLYNYFCRESSHNKIYRLRKVVLIVGAGIIGIFFPITGFIEIYITDYVNAIPSIKVLFAAQFVLIEVNAIYLNLYKVRNLQKKYLFRMLTITIVAFMTNVLCGYIWKDIAAYALATLCTSAIWLIMCQKDLPDECLSYREGIYILLTVAGYFIGGLFPTWIGMGIYICWIIIETLLVFPGDIYLWSSTLIRVVTNKTHKDKIL